MKSVSNAYKASMKALMRNRTFVKVTLSNVDVAAATDGDWVSNGQQGYSEFDTVDYNYDYGNTYATLELNRWTLDGVADILPVSPGNDGFVSNKLSGADGSFVTAATLTREFSNPHEFPGLTLTFDSRCEEWVTDITVVFYLNGSVVDTQTLSAITSTQVIVNTSASEVDKLIVTFGNALPYRYPRLETVLYGVTKVFENDVLVSTTQSHDVDPLSRRLPAETFTFAILDYEHNYDPDNPSGIYAYVDAKSPVSIQFGYELANGTVEWVKADKYVLNSKPTVANNQATFTGTGLIGSLTDTFYKSCVGSKSFYDMAQAVLEDAGLTLTEQGTNPWDIDNTLANMFTTAVLPIDTHMNCLQLIAHACGCRLFTDDDNVIHLKPFGVTVVGIYGGTWSDNGHAWFSEWDTVEKGNGVGNTYATLELNRWTLDGADQIIIPDDDPSGRGYVGSVLSGSTGAFATTPTATKIFDVSHDLPSVAIRFDVPTGEYPKSVTVKYYRGSTLLDTKTVSDITSSEVFVTSTVTECNKIVVTASGGLPYRYLRIEKVYYRETDFTLDFTSISKDSQAISKIDQLKAVSVSLYSYSVADDVSTLFEGTTTGTTLHVEFSSLAQNVAISVTRGTLVSSNIYGRAADLVLSSGTKTVKVTGKTLTESSVVVTDSINSEGEVDTEENPLITNETMRSALASHVAAYLQMRNTYDAAYRGNPEMEVGDIIGLQTNYTDEMDALILVDEITFNGSLSGKMKVKGLI